MAEMRALSLLFSLNQPTRSEARRREEEREATRQAELDRVACIEAERRARMGHEALRQAEAAWLRAEAAARREEAARIEAVRAVEAERRRIEAEQRARIAFVEQQQAHERRLFAIEHEAQQRRWKTALAFGAALTVAVFGEAAAAYFGCLKPQAEQARRRERAVIAEHEAQVARLKVDLARATQRAESTQKALQKASDVPVTTP